MTKENFLSELREALNGSISPASVNENIRYYEEYIETEKQRGRGEEEIMEELGEPRLIARTIIDTADSNDKRGVRAVYESGDEVGDDGAEYRQERAYGGNIRYTRISGVKAILVILAVFLVFIGIFALALFLVGSFIVAFWPAIIIAIAIWWILNPLKGD